MKDESLFKIENLNVKFEDKQVLDNISFSMEKGKIITILGPNGSGKTTLVRCILGLIKPDSGRITLSPKLKIGYMPQKLNLNKNLPLTAYDFLKLEINGKLKNLDHYIAKVGIRKILDIDLQKLSGGEMQKLLLTKAILKSPNLLILDEPVSGLDITGQIEFYKLIDKLRSEQNMAILIISHDLHTVMKRADHVICLHHHICCEGAPEDINKQSYFNNTFDSEILKTLAIYEHHHDHKH